MFMRGASSNPHHLFLLAKLLECLYQALTKQTLISAHAWNLEGVHFISHMWNKSEFYSKLSLNSLINISIINFNNCFPISTPVEHFWYVWDHWSLSPWHGHLCLLQLLLCHLVLFLIFLQLTFIDLLVVFLYLHFSRVHTISSLH